MGSDDDNFPRGTQTRNLQVDAGVEPELMVGLGNAIQQQWLQQSHQLTGMAAENLAERWQLKYTVWFRQH